MSSNVKRAKIDPVVVDLTELEELLATDALFIEYFNEYLRLPNFPEPLCFNKETGGFEVVNDCKRQLAQQIKGAIRSQKRTPKIYRTAKYHSYVDIPLFPINGSSGEKFEIDTSFDVTILNKEQGIHWVKAERLPAFLESDKYHQYRLAKIISQCRLTGDNGEFVTMKIDYSLRPRKEKVVIECESSYDLKTQMMKKLYISLGSSTSVQSDSWFNTAQNTESTEMTFTTLNHPISSTCYSTSAVPASMVDLRCRHDSGSQLKNSGYTASYLSSLSPRLNAHRGKVKQEVPASTLFSVNLKPNTPRPSENVCVMTSDIDLPLEHYTPPVYCTKPETTDSESGVGDMLGDDIAAGRDLAEDTISAELLKLQQKTYSATTVDQLGEMYANAIIRSSIADVTKIQDKVLEDYNILKNVKKDEETMLKDDNLKDDNLKEAVQDKKGGESDVDSLLDSEEDYEEQDMFFRRHKYKTYNLSTFKGIEQFKKFLKGTRGEAYWNMWLDIDRSHMLTNKAEILLVGRRIDPLQFGPFSIPTSAPQLVHQRLCYLSNMRERYHRPGAPYELSTEFKMSLGLVEPSQWKLSKLQSIQMKLVEPLILYWGPRFLLKQLMKINPEKYYMYNQQQQSLRMMEVVPPNPPTPCLLPLRPKSCQARLGHTTLVITDALQSSSSENDMDNAVTSPRVGMRRMFSNLPSRQSQSAKSYNQPRTRKKPKDFLSSKTDLTRNPLASARLSARSRPHSANSLHRSLSAQSNLSTSSSDSADHQNTSQPFTGFKVKISSRTASAFTSRTTSAMSSRPQSTIPLLPTSAVPSRPMSGFSFRPETATSLRPETATSLRPDTAMSLNLLTATSRPSSAVSNKSGCSDETDSSDFLGGQRMEALLQSLRYDQDSGCFFRKFVKKSNNMLWVNALQFWNDVQDYHQQFYTKIIDPYTVEKMAHVIYSQYIVVGASRDIDCPKEMRFEIYKCIKPAYEELFDPAEELALSFLYEAWMYNIQRDVKAYKKVQLINVTRHIETKSKQILNLLNRGVIKERIQTPDNPMEGYKDPVYDEHIKERIPEEFRDYSLEMLVHNRIELEHFRQFLSDNYASMDLMCWMDMESWRRIPPKEDRRINQKAKEIKNLYLNKKYFFGPNSPAGKEGQNKVMEAGGGWGKLLLDRPPNVIIMESQKYVQERLEKKWLPLMLATEEFQARQHISMNMDDVVGDVMVQKNRRSQAVSKLLESRWISSSNEIMGLRRALQNPLTAKQFRKYVSNFGEFLENDVLFWQEIQKYKELNHIHSDEKLISQKINTIVNSFIESTIPPALQVDITQEMADKIIQKKHEKGPYLFREAQMTIFHVLFAYWLPFCKFRANLTDEKVKSTLDRMHKRHLEKLQEEHELAKERDKERKQYDPFMFDDEKYQSMSEYELDKIQWKYSQYVYALEKEELVNNCDESTFSSLPDHVFLDTQEQDDNESASSSQNLMSTPPMKSFHAVETQPLSRGKHPKVKAESEKSSTPEVYFHEPKLLIPEKAESIQTTQVGPDKKTRFEKQATIIQSKPYSTHPGSLVPLIDPNAGKVKLSRQMPPLVQKKP